MDARFEKESTYCPLISIALLFIISFSVYSQDLTKEFPLSFKVEIKNPMDKSRQEVMVHLPAQEIFNRYKDFNPDAFVVLDDQQTEIPSQYNSNHLLYKGIVLVLNDLNAREKVRLWVRYKKEGKTTREYPKRTQAEISHKVNGKFEDRKYIGGEFKNVDSLRVPDEHTDHSYFIRYEGPGWESDKVGYRFYLDWRNAVDVFGKKTQEMVLQNVGQDGFDSYHEMAPWGMDVMKVGESLGIGSIGYFNKGKARRIDEVDSVITVIPENGPVFSAVTTRYYSWTIADGVDVTSYISIHAGSRLTHQQISIPGSGTALCTGIGKDEKAKVFSNRGDKSSWGYVATFGPQSLNDDNLGVAVLFPPQDFLEFTEDSKNHIVRLKENDSNFVEYYYLAAWELEPNGIKEEAEFLQYLQQTASELANPVMVRFK